MFNRGLLKEYSPLFSFVIRVFDLFVVVFGGAFAYYIRFGDWKLNDDYRIALLIGGLVTALILPAFRLYHSWRGKSFLAQFWLITLSWGSAFFILALVAFSTKTGAVYSRYWAVIWVITVWLLLVISRVLVRVGFNILRKQGWNHRHIIIIGAGVLGKNVAKQLSNNQWVGYDIDSFWDDNEALQGGDVLGIPVISPEEGAKMTTSKQERLDEIWLALPLCAENRVREILHMLRHSMLRVRFVPDIFAFRLLNHSMAEIAGIPLLDIAASPMVGMNRLIKAMEDRFLAVLILILVSPLLVLIAVGVKMGSPGPMLFKQMRHGWDGKPFEVYKFRTMVVQDESDREVKQAVPGDPRVTRFGAFLRKTSLDELPQFFNVLQGQMSIVGPRPHALAHNEFYKEQVEAYMQRHRVKPGITGWAQVNGWRGETNTLEKMQRRVEYDLFYIENWSFWFDLKIIFLTIFKGFFNKNAY